MDLIICEITTERKYKAIDSINDKLVLDYKTNKRKGERVGRMKIGLVTKGHCNFTGGGELAFI